MYPFRNPIGDNQSGGVVDFTRGHFPLATEACKCVCVSVSPPVKTSCPDCKLETLLRHTLAHHLFRFDCASNREAQQAAVKRLESHSFKKCGLS